MATTQAPLNAGASGDAGGGPDANGPMLDWDLPPEVRLWFRIVTGEEYPDVHLRELLLLADAWDTAADRLAVLRPSLTHAVNYIKSTFNGQTEQAFAAKMAPFVTGSHNFVDAAVAHFRRNAIILRNLALDAEYMRLVVLYSLVLLIAEFYVALQLSYWTAGASMGVFKVLFLKTRALLTRLMRWLTMRFGLAGKMAAELMFALVASMAFQLTVDAGAQTTQFMLGTRSEWNTDYTRSAAVVAATSALLAPIFGPFGQMSEKMVKDVLSRAATIQRSEGRSWSDSVAKAVGTVLQEAGHEFSAEVLAQYFLTGQWEANWAAATAGAVSGIATVAGSELGTKLANGKTDPSATTADGRQLPPPEKDFGSDSGGDSDSGSGGAAAGFDRPTAFDSGPRGNNPGTGDRGTGDAGSGSGDVGSGFDDAGSGLDDGSSTSSDFDDTDDNTDTDSVAGESDTSVSDFGDDDGKDGERTAGGLDSTGTQPRTSSDVTGTAAPGDGESGPVATADASSGPAVPLSQAPETVSAQEPAGTNGENRGKDSGLSISGNEPQGTEGQPMPGNGTDHPGSDAKLLDPTMPSSGVQPSVLTLDQSAVDPQTVTGQVNTPTTAPAADPAPPSGSPAPATTGPITTTPTPTPNPAASNPVAPKSSVRRTIASSRGPEPAGKPDPVVTEQRQLPGDLLRDVRDYLPQQDSAKEEGVPAVAEAEAGAPGEVATASADPLPAGPAPGDRDVVTVQDERTPVRDVLDSAEWQHSAQSSASWFDARGWGSVAPRSPEWEAARSRAEVRTMALEVRDPRDVRGETETGRLPEARFDRHLVRYDLRRFEVDGYTVQEYTVRIKLDDSRVSEQEANAVRRSVPDGLDRLVNKGYRLPTSDRVYVRVEFVGPADPAHAEVTLLPRNDTRTTNQVVWNMRDLPRLPHEVMHFPGLTDEYLDQRSVFRGRAQRSRVILDDGLMGGPNWRKWRFQPRHAWLIERTMTSEFGRASAWNAVAPQALPDIAAEDPVWLGRERGARHVAAPGGEGASTSAAPTAVETIPVQAVSQHLVPDVVNGLAQLARGTAARNDGFAEHGVLGPDLFGLRQKPAAVVSFPDILTLSAAQAMTLLDRMDMLRPEGLPQPAEVTAEALAAVEQNVAVSPWPAQERAFWEEQGVDWSTVPAMREMPATLHGIWLGGPLRSSGRTGAFQAQFAESAAVFGGQSVLWTDVPRSDVEDVLRAGADVPDSLSGVREMVEWARHNDIRLLNVDELFDEDHPMVLDQEYRSELAKGTPKGYTGSADIARVEKIFRFGGLYLDGDDALTDVRPFHDMTDSPDGYAVYTQVINPPSGPRTFANNSAMAMVKGHPFGAHYLGFMAKNFAKPQVRLHPAAVVAQTAEYFDTVRKPSRNWSIPRRSGPFGLMELMAQLGRELPKLGGVRMGSAHTWAATQGSARTALVSTGDMPATVALTARVVQTLVRQLYNRSGNLDLTLAFEGARQHEDPGMVLTSAVAFIAEVPALRGMVSSITDTVFMDGRFQKLSLVDAQSMIQVSGGRDTGFLGGLVTPARLESVPRYALGEAQDGGWQDLLNSVTPPRSDLAHEVRQRVHKVHQALAAARSAGQSSGSREESFVGLPSEDEESTDSDESMADVDESEEAYDSNDEGPSPETVRAIVGGLERMVWHTLETDGEFVDHSVLGQDLFGFLRSPAPVVRLPDIAGLSAAQAMTLLDRMDMLRPRGLPRAEELTAESLASVPQGVMRSEWSPRERAHWERLGFDWSAAPAFREIPNTLHGTWVGGPLGGSDKAQVLRDRFAASAEAFGGQAVLWTDVPRSQVEQALAWIAGQTPGQATGQPPPALVGVVHMVRWASANRIRLVNEHEVFSGENSFRLEAYYRSELATGVPKGFAGSSDISRVEKVYRFGGLHLDVDDILRDAQPFRQLIDAEHGFAMNTEDQPNGVFVYNNVVAMAKGHPFGDVYLQHMAKNFALAQLDVFPPELAFRRLEFFDFMQGRPRTWSIPWRSGPWGMPKLVERIEMDPPRLTGVQTGIANTWSATHGSGQSRLFRTTDHEATTDITARVAHVLIRQLTYNRRGDLDLVRGWELARRHEDPRLVLTSAVVFIGSVPALREAVTTITDTAIVDGEPLDIAPSDVVFDMVQPRDDGVVVFMGDVLKPIRLQPPPEDHLPAYDDPDDTGGWRDMVDVPSRPSLADELRHRYALMAQTVGASSTGERRGRPPEPRDSGGESSGSTGFVGMPPQAEADVSPDAVRAVVDGLDRRAAETARRDEGFVRRGTLPPDLFGLQRPPAPVVGIPDLAELTAAQAMTLLDRMDMLRPQGLPSARELTPEALAEVRQDVTRSPWPAEERAFWEARRVDFATVPALREMPNTLHGTWYGGPVRASGSTAVFRARFLQSARAFNGQVVLWTDVPRSQVEQARPWAYRMDRPPEELAGVVEMVEWAQTNNILLVNVNEVFTADHPFQLDEHFRSELAKGTPKGYTGSSDISRVEKLYLIGGMHLDGDDTLLDVRPFRGIIRQTDGYAVYSEPVVDADGLPGEFANNNAIAMVKGHPFGAAYLAHMRERFESGQPGVFPPDIATGPAESFDVMEEIPRSWSIPWRSGPFGLPRLLEQLELESFPRLNGVLVGNSQTWNGSQGSGRTDLVPATDVVATTDLTARAVHALLRQLYNRPGNLELTRAWEAARQHENPELVLTAAVVFLSSVPAFRSAVSTLTDETVVEGEPFQVPLADVVRGILNRGPGDVVTFMGDELKPVRLAEPPPDHLPSEPGAWRDLLEPVELRSMADLIAESREAGGQPRGRSPRPRDVSGSDEPGFVGLPPGAAPPDASTLHTAQDVLDAAAQLDDVEVPDEVWTQAETILRTTHLARSLRELPGDLPMAIVELISDRLLAHGGEEGREEATRFSRQLAHNLGTSLPPATPDSRQPATRGRGHRRMQSLDEPSAGRRRRPPSPLPSLLHGSSPLSGQDAPPAASSARAWHGASGSSSPSTPPADWRSRLRPQPRSGASPLTVPVHGSSEEGGTVRDGVGMARRAHARPVGVADATALRTEIDRAVRAARGRDSHVWPDIGAVHSDKAVADNFGKALKPAGWTRIAAGYQITVRVVDIGQTTHEDVVSGERLTAPEPVVVSRSSLDAKRVIPFNPTDFLKFPVAGFVSLELHVEGVGVQTATESAVTESHTSTVEITETGSEFHRGHEVSYEVTVQRVDSAGNPGGKPYTSPLPAVVPTTLAWPTRLAEDADVLSLSYPESRPGTPKEQINQAYADQQRELRRIRATQLQGLVEAVYDQAVTKFGLTPVKDQRGATDLRNWLTELENDHGKDILTGHVMRRTFAFRQGPTEVIVVKARSPQAGTSRPGSSGSDSRPSTPGEGDRGQRTRIHRRQESTQSRSRLDKDIKPVGGTVGVAFGETLAEIVGAKIGVKVSGSRTAEDFVEHVSTQHLAVSRTFEGEMEPYEAEFEVVVAFHEAPADWADEAHRRPEEHTPEQTLFERPVTPRPGSRHGRIRQWLHWSTHHQDSVKVPVSGTIWVARPGGDLDVESASESEEDSAGRSKAGMTAAEVPRQADASWELTEQTVAALADNLVVGLFDSRRISATQVPGVRLAIAEWALRESRALAGGREWVRFPVPGEGRDLFVRGNLQAGRRVAQPAQRITGSTEAGETTQRQATRRKDASLAVEADVEAGPLGLGPGVSLSGRRSHGAGLSEAYSERHEWDDAGAGNWYKFHLEFSAVLGWDLAHLDQDLKFHADPRPGARSGAGSEKLLGIVKIDVPTRPGIPLDVEPRPKQTESAWLTEPDRAAEPLPPLREMALPPVIGVQAMTPIGDMATTATDMLMAPVLKAGSAARETLRKLLFGPSPAPIAGPGDGEANQGTTRDAVEQWGRWDSRQSRLGLAAGPGDRLPLTSHQDSGVFGSRDLVGGASLKTRYGNARLLRYDTDHEFERIHDTRTFMPAEQANRWGPKAKLKLTVEIPSVGEVEPEISAGYQHERVRRQSHTVTTSTRYSWREPAYLMTLDAIAELGTEVHESETRLFGGRHSRPGTTLHRAKYVPDQLQIWVPARLVATLGDALSEHDVRVNLREADRAAYLAASAPPSAPPSPSAPAALPRGSGDFGPARADVVDEWTQALHTRLDAWVDSLQPEAVRTKYRLLVAGAVDSLATNLVLGGFDDIVTDSVTGGHNMLERRTGDSGKTDLRLTLAGGLTDVRTDADDEAYQHQLVVSVASTTTSGTSGQWSAGYSATGKPELGIESGVGAYAAEAFEPAVAGTWQRTAGAERKPERQHTTTLTWRGPASRERATLELTVAVNAWTRPGSVRKHSPLATSMSETRTLPDKLVLDSAVQRTRPAYLVDAMNEEPKDIATGSLRESWGAGTGFPDKAALLAEPIDAPELVATLDELANLLHPNRSNWLLTGARGTQLARHIRDLLAAEPYLFAVGSETVDTVAIEADLGTRELMTVVPDAEIASEVVTSVTTVGRGKSENTQETSLVSETAAQLTGPLGVSREGRWESETQSKATDAPIVSKGKPYVVRAVFRPTLVVNYRNGQSASFHFHGEGSRRIWLTTDEAGLTALGLDATKAGVTAREKGKQRAQLSLPERSTAIPDIRLERRATVVPESSDSSDEDSDADDGRLSLVRMPPAADEGLAGLWESRSSADPALAALLSDVDGVREAVAFQSLFQSSPAGPVLSGAPEVIDSRRADGLREALDRVREPHSAAVVFAHDASGRAKAWNVVNDPDGSTIAAVLPGAAGTLRGVVLVDPTTETGVVSWRDGSVTPEARTAFGDPATVKVLALDENGEQVTKSPGPPVPPAGTDEFALLVYRRDVEVYRIQQELARRRTVVLPGIGRLIPGLGGVRLIPERAGEWLSASVAAGLAAVSLRDIVLQVLGPSAQEPPWTRVPPRGRPIPL